MNCETITDLLAAYEATHSVEKYNAYDWQTRGPGYGPWHTVILGVNRLIRMIRCSATDNDY